MDKNTRQSNESNRSDDPQAGAIPPERFDQDDHEKNKVHEDDTDRPLKRHQVAVLICGFLASLQTLGVAQAYGLFQLYHAQHLGSSDKIIPDEQAKNHFSIAFVGTLGSAGIIFTLSLLVVPFLHPLSIDTPQRWPWFNNVSILSTLGSLYILIGYGAASFSNQLWQLLLWQGFTVGLGCCLLFNPIVTIAPEYFGRNQGKAMGFITAGIATGGVVYPFVVRGLLERVSYRWALRILGISVAAVGILTVAAFAPPPRASKNRRRPLLTEQVLKDPIFYLTVLTGFSGALTVGVPFGFEPEFSKIMEFNRSIGVGQLALLTSVGIPARLMWGAVRDQIGSQNTLIISTMTLLIADWIWLFSATCYNKTAWWTFLIVCGASTGGYGTVISSYILDLFDPEVFFGTMAVVNFARGIGALAGSPIGGLLIGNGNTGKTETKDFFKLIWVDGGLLIATVILLVLVRVWHARRVGFKWIA